MRKSSHPQNHKPSTTTRHDAEATRSERPRVVTSELNCNVGAFDATTTTAALVTSGVCVALSAVLAIAVNPRLGWALAALSASYWLWFVVVRQRLNAVPLAMQAIVEGLIPTLVLFVVAAAAGSIAALRSWIPLVGVGVAVVLSTLRLNPWKPVGASVGAAVAYLGLYLTALKSTVEPSDAFYAAPIQWTRALIIVVIGAIGSLVAARLRAKLCSSTRPRLNDTFDKYRIGAEIAAGGMGVVHAATCRSDGGSERKVAIKRIHPRLIVDRRVVEAFRVEAEIGSKLRHPNIVATLDFGRAGETYFLAMELVDGVDLSRVLSRARRDGKLLSEAAVLELARAVAAALDYAHTEVRDQSGAPLRVIHQDLSPANVLVCRRGRVKLSDFGVARALRGGDAHVSGPLAGKLAYMAPEQVRGKDVDERSDLYALGLILFEALTLVPAQGRGTDAETLTVMLEGTPPSAVEHRPTIVPGWDALFQSLLARDHELRPATASALDETLQALEHELANRPSSDDPGLSLAAFVDDVKMH